MINDFSADDLYDAYGFWPFSSWQDKIIDVLITVTKKSRAEWSRIAPVIWDVYKQAVESGAYPRYTLDKAGQAVAPFVALKTGLSLSDVSLYLQTLYRLALNGTIAPRYWSPDVYQQGQEYKTAATVAAVKRAIMPAAAIGGQVVAPTVNKILILGAIGAVGYFLARDYVAKNVLPKRQQQKKG
ncbi:hypothetical protein EH223_08505 [candidate division KSB1 bacterium]|nr:MAG: hypothetical protein EH223_08505 [candidate division KSB1 bacterium]